MGLSLAQTYNISGTILNSKTKEPIENTNVFIENSNIGSTTDDEGYFLLSLNNNIKKTIIIKIKIIGFEEKIITVDLINPRINLNDIYLEVQSIKLKPIHVHSHKNESKQISDINLSGQELNNNLLSNLALTLSSQPNIGVNSFGVVTSKPVLRGFSGDRFLITKEGSNLGDLSKSSIDHVITLDMSEVNEVEIIRGPKSLLFGSNAIGGVINTTIMGNAKTKVDKFYRNFTFGGETYNKGLHSNLMFYIPHNNNQFNILINNRNTNNQTSPIGTLENTYSNTSNLKLSYSKYNKHNFLNFVFENFKMNYGIPPSYEGHINGVDIELFKNTFQINYHQDLSFGKFNQLDVKYNFIDYEHQEFESNSNNYSVALSKISHNVKMEIKSLESTLGAEFNYKEFLPGGFYWTPPTDELNIELYGFTKNEYNNFDLLSSFRLGYLTVKPNQNNLSFSNLDIEDINKRNFKYLSSSIGIRKVINKFEINSWIMNTMKAPQIEELYSDGPHLGSYSYEIGEPNLKLEKIYGIESSVAYNSNPINTSITAFYNYSPYYYQMTKMGNCEENFIIGESHPCSGADFIEWGSGSSGWLYKYRTEGIRSIIKGIEYNLEYNIADLKIVYDFSLVYGDNLTSKTPLSYINPTKETLNLDYKHNYMNYKLRLSKIHSQDRLGEFETYTPSSFLIDFIVGYNFKNQNITIQLNNMLNEKYYNHLSKIKSIMPEAGRNMVISYKVLF